MLFGHPRENIHVNHSLEKLKVIYMNHFLFYAINSYQFKLVEQTDSSSF